MTAERLQSGRPGSVSRTARLHTEHRAADATLLDVVDPAGVGAGVDADDFLCLGVHVRGSGVVLRDGAEIALAPGDLIFCGPSDTGVLRLDPDARTTFVRLPRASLGATTAELDRVEGCHVPGGDGVGALVSAFLTSLAAEGEELRRSRVGELLARNAVDLVAVLVTQLLDGSAPGDPLHPIRQLPPADALFARIRGFVEDHLADPELSPRTIARAHHISVRHLHKLFQGEGTTVGRWIRSRRLESCRRDLDGPAGRRPTVAAVARRWGFISPSHFSRAFRETYGMSPRAWQERAGTEHRTPPAPPAPPATPVTPVRAALTPAE